MPETDSSPGAGAGSLFAEGLELHRRGRLGEAASAYEGVLARDPGHADALYHLSLVRAAEGQLEQALELARRAQRAQPGSAAAHAQAGGILAMLYRPEEALAELREALAIDPGRADVANNIGAVLRALGRLDEAYPYFARAVELQPSYGDALQNLAGTLTAARRFEEAVGVLERIVAQGSASAAIYDELGKALWHSGRTPAGIARFREAIALDPAHANAWAHLGSALVEAGELAEAVQAFLTAIALAPERGEFYRFLAEVKPSALTPEHVAALEELARVQTQTPDRIDVHFALGKTYAAAGDARRAFEHLTTANAASRPLHPYDEAATLESFEQIARVFTADFLERRRGGGEPSDFPVFIFGMPRSGTTLVEQIIATHPRAYGAGELALFEESVNDVLGNGRSPSAVDMLGAEPAALRRIGERYAAALRALAPAGAQRITDKMPANFRFAGLIHLALPNARMIHACRDPLETCLSCFLHTFAGEGLGFTYDLGELGRYYRGYAKLMDHWRAVLPPGALLEMRYEELVEDFEAQARRLIAFCGLPWDDACLAFYNTRREVKTASAAQVRRPLYRSSLHRAREYGDLLQPLIAALGQ